jgi:hypothetical protein
MRPGYEAGLVVVGPSMLLTMNYKYCNRKIRQHLLFITELDVNKFVTYVSLGG